MAGKASKAAPSAAAPANPEPPAADASEPQTENVDASTKIEEGGVRDADAPDSSAKAEEAASYASAAKPSIEAAQDDAVSHTSSGSDDKANNSSSSKKSPSKSKKGGRNSRGKSTSSKRSSEEQDAAKDAEADAPAEADPAVSTSTAIDATSAAETQQADLAHEATGAEATAIDAELTAESSDAAAGGRDNINHKGASKELAQLGLSSFGDNGDEEVVGPRRSRRGPGASPDPKARIPKTEPDTDTTSLQDPSAADSTNANASNDATAEGVDANASSAHQDDKVEAEASAAPEEVASEAQAEAKTEEEDEQYLGPETPATEDDDNQLDAVGAYIEDVEADYGDADEQGNLDGEEGGDEGVTRCVCGSADENVGLMIQCETCKCWQHCVCMGMQVEEDCPDVYYCEQCRPELHIPLLRSLGLLPKAAKKGTGKGAKYSARELKEAKEAIALLAEENARRNEAAEAAAAYNSRDRKGGASSRREESKEIPKSPKRRNTMNSRDSAYGGWEPIPPGLLADGEVWEGADDKKGGKKRKRGHPDDAGDSAAQTPELGEGAGDAASDVAKRRRMSAGHPADHDADADMDEDDLSGGADHSGSASKSHKKKKGNNQYIVRETSVTADSSASKPRHPNQYTYRNKDKNGNHAANGQKTGSSSTSNLTSHSPSPSPSKGRAEHARRAAARDNGYQIGTPAPGEFSGSASRGGQQPSTIQWGLPEHLTHLSYLLPNGGSSQLGSAKPQAPTNENGGASKKGATSLSTSSSGQSSSGGPSPPAGASFPTPFQVLSSIESSTKVRFPSRRMTMSEMRKRVRNIGEYMTRSQIEAVEREKRMKLLSIVPPYMEEPEEEAEMEVESTQDDTKDGGEANPTESGPGENANQEARKEDGSGQSKQERLPLSMRLMEELTRELINFQRKFGNGPGSHGSLSSSHQSTTVS